MLFATQSFLHESSSVPSTLMSKGVECTYFECSAEHRQP